MAGERQCMESAAFPRLPQSKWVVMLLFATFFLSHYGLMVEARKHGDGVTEDSLESTAQGLVQFVEKLPSLSVVKGYTVSPEGAYLPANLTIGMYKTQWVFHRALPPTTVFAYGLSPEKATVPGPSIVAMNNVKTYVKWENHLPNNHIFTTDATLDSARPTTGIPTVTHLHGGVSEPPSDGSSMGWFTRNYQEKGSEWKKEVYEYENDMTTVNMWYHDHAFGFTRLNLLAGLVGPYKVMNPEVDKKLGLPTGRFDRQLVVMDRSFTADGQIYINSTGNNPDLHPEWQPEYFGDVIIVNGKAWPRMTVQRRKYRFRIINASNARFFRFALDDGTKFTQIGADSFYLEKPVRVSSILVAPSEIVDLVIDFSETKSSSLVLTNDAAYPFPDGDIPNEWSGKVMKFMIDAKPVMDMARVPDTLATVERLAKKDAVVNRDIVLYEFDSDTDEPTHLLINFAYFDAPVTETPRNGTTEVWHIFNLTPDNHPIHIHLAAFQVMYQRQLNNTDALLACAEQKKVVGPCRLKNYLTGPRVPPIPGAAGWKNVYQMQPFFVTSILIRFSLIDSRAYPFDPSVEPGYAYHCHILDHEDNSMMRPYHIVL